MVSLRNPFFPVGFGQCFNHRNREKTRREVGIKERGAAVTILAVFGGGLSVRSSGKLLSALSLVRCHEEDSPERMPGL